MILQRPFWEPVAEVSVASIIRSLGTMEKLLLKDSLPAIICLVLQLYDHKNHLGAFSGKHFVHAHNKMPKFCSRSRDSYRPLDLYI